MTPLPKRRPSRSRRGKRRSHSHLDPINLSLCPQCRRFRLPHHVCPYCGFYGGRKVIEVKQAKR